MKKTLLPFVAFVSLIAFAGQVQASIEIVGDLLEGNSWGQDFKETGTYTFSALRVVYQEPAPNTLFESFSSTKPGWSQTFLNATYPVPYGQTPGIVAKGPSTSVLPFTLWFTNSAPPSKINFYVEVGNFGTDGGFARIDATSVNWNGTRWTIHNDYVPQLNLYAVPEPATIIVWSLLGATWAGGLTIVRRRRLAWTPEAREAIAAIIERGRLPR
jgi:hypothetical protein